MTAFALPTSPSLKYIAHYPEHIRLQATQLITAGKLGDYIDNNYPTTHQIQSDKALYHYINEIKNQYMRKSSPLSAVSYNSKLAVLNQALGIHTYQSRVQGNKLKSHNSITVASLFKEAPPEFLRMIVVHELAHFKEKDHDKAFYQLCCHMEPHYHQFELDTRLWLQWREL